MLSNTEWIKLFLKNPTEAIKADMLLARDESKACWKCFQMHSEAQGCKNIIPEHWMAI